MRTVVFYEDAHASMDDFMKFLPEHQVVEEEFIRNGKVVGIGVFSNPGEGAMAIFKNKTDAREFVERDPFAAKGLYSKVTMRAWRDELSTE